MGKPDIRFKGYTDEWEQRKVVEVAPLQRGFDLPSASMKPGKYPVVMSNGIGGYHFEYKVKGPGVVTGRSGTIGKLHYIEDDYWPHNTTLWVTEFKGNNQKFIYYLYQGLGLNRFGTGSGVPTLNRNDIHDVIVSVPPKNEQEKISSYLTTLDHLITLHQRKCDEVKSLKKYMLQKMFPQNEQKVLEIRFEGFTEAWEQRKFGELGSVAMCKRIFKEQTSPVGDIPFYKIGTFGAEPDAFISRELFEEYKEKFQYPKIGDMLISASGTIGRTVEYDGEEAYFQDSNIVWFKHDERVDNSFLKCIYGIIKWSGIEGSTIKRLYNDNFLKTEFYMPSVAEQEKIGEYFANLDHLITLHQQKCEELKKIKKFMLQKMFV